VVKDHRTGNEKVIQHPEGVQDEGRTPMGSTFFSLHYQIVFSTKERRSVIRAEWRPRLHSYLGACLHPFWVRAITADHGSGSVWKVARASRPWITRKMRVPQSNWFSPIN